MWIRPGLKIYFLLGQDKIRLQLGDRLQPGSPLRDDAEKFFDKAEFIPEDEVGVMRIEEWGQPEDGGGHCVVARLTSHREGGLHLEFEVERKSTGENEVERSQGADQLGRIDRSGKD